MNEDENMPTYEILKDSPKILPMIYTDVAQPAVQKVGKALETVFDFCNTILLPLKLVNQKASLNFQKHMNNYKEKLECLKDDEIVDVSTIIGTPIIDRLTYVTNDEIAELFINLLTTASSSETVNEAHPSFIHIIDRMTIDECRLIKHLETISFIPFINIHLYTRSGVGYQKMAWDLTALEFDVELIAPENIDTYLNNLASLKIIDHQGKIFKDDEKIYDSLKVKYSDLIQKMNDDATTKPEHLDECKITSGLFEITDLGRAFIKSCNNKAQP